VIARSKHDIRTYEYIITDRYRTSTRCPDDHVAADRDTITYIDFSRIVSMDSARPVRMESVPYGSANWRTHFTCSTYAERTGRSDTPPPIVTSKHDTDSLWQDVEQ